MKIKKVTPGDVILIPVLNAGFGVAKVLYASRIYRNVVLLGIYKMLVAEVAMPPDLPKEFVSPLVYTGSQGIKKGLWPMVGNAGVTDAEKTMSCRVVADHVYVGDECIRVATAEDRKSLPWMGVAGSAVVEEFVSKVVASLEN